MLGAAASTCVHALKQGRSEILATLASTERGAAGCQRRPLLCQVAAHYSSSWCCCLPQTLRRKDAQVLRPDMHSCQTIFENSAFFDWKALQSNMCYLGIRQHYAWKHCCMLHCQTLMSNVTHHSPSTPRRTSVQVHNILQGVKIVCWSSGNVATKHAAMACHVQSESGRTVPGGLSEASGILYLQDLSFSGLHQHLSLIAHRHSV